jgi:glucans biosynthesis protein C
MANKIKTPFPDTFDAEAGSVWLVLWDARGLLAILGIVLHTARIYAPKSFALSDPELHIFFRHLIDLIHAFRMEAFFLLSGAALYIVSVKHQSGIFADRTRRLLIPFISTALLLNLPVLELCHFVIPQRMQEWHEFDLLKAGFWLSGDWIMHLWFIRDLMIYTLIYCLVSSSSKITCLANHLFANLPRGIFLPCLGLLMLAPSVVGYLFPTLAKPLLGEGNALLGSVKGHLYYGLYFGLGILIARYPHLARRLVQPRTSLLLSSLLVCFLCLILTRVSLAEQALHSILGGTILVKVIIELVGQLSVFALIYLAIQLVAILRKTSIRGELQRSAKASYTIYLVHQPVVWALAISFQTLALPIWIKFTAIMFLTYAICMGFSNLLVLGKISWTRLMFTGRLYLR